VSDDDTTDMNPAEEGAESIERAADAAAKDTPVEKDAGAVPVRTPRVTRAGGLTGGKRTWIVSGVAAVLLVAAAAALTVTGIRYSHASSRADDSRDAVAAGRLAAESMFGYDPKTVDKNVATARGLVIDDAAKQFGELVDQQNMVLIVKKNNVSSNLAVQGLGVQDSSRNSANLLIFMNQSITRGDNQLVDIQASRLVFTMKRVGGKWKVSEIDKISDDSVNKSLQPQGQTPTNADPAIGGAPPDSTAPEQPAGPQSPAPQQPQATDAPAAPGGP